MDLLTCSGKFRGMHVKLANGPTALQLCLDHCNKAILCQVPASQVCRKDGRRASARVSGLQRGLFVGKKRAQTGGEAIRFRMESGSYVVRCLPSVILLVHCRPEPPAYDYVVRAPCRPSGIGILLPVPDFRHTLPPTLDPAGPQHTMFLAIILD